MKSTKKTPAKGSAATRPAAKKSLGPVPPKAPPSPAAAPAPAEPLVAPESGVTVRMYRQGLGDCFLLAFPSKDGGRPYYMLIDCGVILGTANAGNKMTEVVRHIQGATGGRLDVIAVTHEHWDHVSGFSQAREVFREFEVGDVWFGWTEDPGDKLARQLKEKFAKDRDSLRVAVQRAIDGDAVAQITTLFGFLGESPREMAGDGGGALAASGANSTSQAMQDVRSLLPEGKEPRYLSPGDVETIDEVPGARFYILGPPHDEATLRRINPTAKGDETYTESSALTPRTAFMMALEDESTLGTDDRELYNLSFPFDASLRISREEAATMEFFRESYGFDQYAPGGPAPGATPHESAWRRIDDDWLGTAGALALQLDSFTNNTSLALAIELAGSKKVLLFAADAQVGNWLSWDNVTWSVEEDEEAATVRIGELLSRAVLYKVGHHGSHNATVRGYGKEKKGLELMTSPDLVAMVPVNHEMALKKRWGKMPFDPLLRRLDEKTCGRVMRIDDGYPKAKPESASAEQWETFQGSFEETPLYMQYTIRD